MRLVVCCYVWACMNGGSLLYEVGRCMHVRTLATHVHTFMHTTGRWTPPSRPLQPAAASLPPKRRRAVSPGPRSILIPRSRIIRYVLVWFLCLSVCVCWVGVDEVTHHLRAMPSVYPHCPHCHQQQEATIPCFVCSLSLACTLIQIKTPTEYHHHHQQQQQQAARPHTPCFMPAPIKTHSQKTPTPITTINNDNRPPPPTPSGGWRRYTPPGKGPSWHYSAHGRARSRSVF